MGINYPDTVYDLHQANYKNKENGDSCLIRNSFEIFSTEHL